MKFTMHREDFLKPLQAVQGVVERRQTLPILANFLLTIDAGRLSVTGTDMELELVATTELPDAESGEITVPARKLVDILTQREMGTTKELDEMARSCLEETGNIISSAFVNSWAKWLDIHSEPQPPQLYVDLAEAILSAVIVDQAAVSDEVFMAKTSFSVDGKWLDWAYYLFPSPSSLRLIETSVE